MDPVVKCCVSGCVRSGRCNVCMRCEEHCICSGPCRLDCGTGPQAFLKAMFTSHAGVRPRARKTRLENAAIGAAADNEHALLSELSKLEVASDIDVTHYTFMRSDGGRSVLTDSEERILRSLSSLISRNEVKLVTTPRDDEAEGNNHGVELVVNTGLLFSTKFMVPSYVRSKFDTMPLPELDNIVLYPEFVKTYRNSGEWVVLLPKINRTIAELEDYNFARSTRYHRHKGFYDPADKDTIGGWIQTVMRDSKGESLRYDIGSEDVARGDVKVVCFVETARNGRRSVVGETFGIVLVKDDSESMTVDDKSLSTSSPETAMSRMWHVNGYEKRIIRRNLQKASAALRNVKVTDLHAISRMARISFEDAAWGVERGLLGIPLNENSGCYLPTMRHRTKAGVNLAPVVLRNVLGVSVFDRDGRLVDREGKQLEIRGGHISHCKEPLEQNGNECYDLEEELNGACKQNSTKAPPSCQRL